MVKCRKPAGRYCSVRAARLIRRDCRRGGWKCEARRVCVDERNCLPGAEQMRGPFIRPKNGGNAPPAKTTYLPTV
jgi:hypothetical protein